MCHNITWVIIMIDYELVGSRIKNARKEKNIFQSELGERLNVSAEYISRVECGKTAVSLKMLDRICEQLSVNLEYLLFGIVVTKENYINNAFTNLLKECSEENLAKIVKVIKTMMNEFDIK